MCMGIGLLIHPGWTSVHMADFFTCTSHHTIQVLRSAWHLTQSSWDKTMNSWLYTQTSRQYNHAYQISVWWFFTLSCFRCRGLWCLDLLHWICSRNVTQLQALLLHQYSHYQLPYAIAPAAERFHCRQFCVIHTQMKLIVFLYIRVCLCVISVLIIVIQFP